jgi:multisubunit Na+/H+ antiporter MnhF subunit
MHAIVFYAAMAWLAVLAGAVMLVTLRSRSMAARILGVDTLTLLLVAALAVVAVRTGASSYLDVALFVALLSFAGTLAAARYLGTRRVY